MKTQTKTKEERFDRRDLYELSSGNLKVLETIPAMMQDDFWRGQLRKLVVEYLNGRCIYK